MLLLFDLDHTLIDSRRTCINSKVPGFGVSFAKCDSLYVHVRPHALELLEYLIQVKFPFGFWTAGTKEYADKVIAGIFQLMGVKHWRHLVMTVRSRASAVKLPNGSYLKNLDVVRKSLDIERVLLIDDDPIHGVPEGNKNCVIPAPPFHADAVEKDHFLAMIMESVRMVRQRSMAKMAKKAPPLPPVASSAPPPARKLSASLPLRPPTRSSIGPNAQAVDPAGRSRRPPRSPQDLSKTIDSRPGRLAFLRSPSLPRLAPGRP